ncbi:hypothetical protein LINPERHAP1_LOCUS41090, partial [Linum perenne]
PHRKNRKSSQGFRSQIRKDSLSTLLWESAELVEGRVRLSVLVAREVGRTRRTATCLSAGSKQ